MNERKIAVIFPGQGSQFLGMGHEFYETSVAAQSLMGLTESVSDSPIRRLSHDGPMEELTEARNLQPALTVTSLMCWQALKESGVTVDYFAGHSLGEYSALCASGILSVEDTIRLVVERGRLMGFAGQENPGRMCAILGLSLHEVQSILAEIDQPDLISIGNYNSSQQLVLSGESSVVQSAADRAVQKGGKAIPLNVSVANHSPLMNQAVPQFERIMDDVLFSQPHTPLLFNVTGKTEDDPKAIRKIMAEQIRSMVRWLDIIENLLGHGVTVFVEVGPKKVLTGLMKRIVPRGAPITCLQFDSPSGLEAVLDTLRELPK